MVRTRKTISALSIFFFLSMIIFFSLETVYSATLYKRYLVVNDLGTDILCEPYIVEKNDYVLKLFKQKGEISSDNFPSFLQIFRRINPDIRDVNNIVPGEEILIPLKKITANAFPNQDTGVIDIPFITITAIPDILQKYSKAHTIQKGEVLSKLVAKNYGNFGTRSYKEGIEILKALNPNIKNLNRIYPGQKIALPSFSLRNELFYSALFDSSGQIKKDGVIDIKKINEQKPKEENEYFVEETSPIKQAASVLNARLHDNGIFFFPQKNGNDIKLDLSKSPFLEKRDGGKILFVNQRLSKENIRSMQKYWQDMEVVTFKNTLSFQKVIDTIIPPQKGKKDKNKIAFSDNGVRVSIKSQWIFDTPEQTTPTKTCVSIIENAYERTPQILCNYMKQNGIIVKELVSSRYASKLNTKKSKKNTYTGSETSIPKQSQKMFVNDLVMALDLYYAPNISISFPYSGIQIKAFANLVSTGSGQELLVDFANLYGDAFDAIKDTGFSVISIKRKEKTDAIITHILEGLKLPYTKNPVFLGANRSPDYNIFVKVPGYYIEKSNQQKYLILLSKINRNLMHFVQNQGIDLILVES